ncbi:peptidoglycan/LPS O-acetylase OafA/YrhL [Microbacteriaceae bacterium SG_E_30_P1]|uniref:Peptidoglycan/LPS O-acetylase OafA/YrhL n=1 Tax=Antiquaquibacter oligotrophicus TaxID=2880260 RepID=A0ABT6KR66_9MICO|nr:acyltransferase [Antiquaquibacter oligotrophicus]MDH6182275.1 peptidoglycan/LPS O-acetylase OafA/YrhL [Antiquaquibacter oligotrophicus]UDF12068.1 acyltransferase [Antiquaquibacter oligotrophicus]
MARTPTAQTAAASIDLSKRDLTLDLARVFCVLLVVVIHLLMVGVGVGADGELIAQTPTESPLGAAPWFPLATWAGQIMPLFFVVGGFASITAWRSLTRRGGTGADYVRNRVLRLAQPALPLYIFYAIVIGAAMVLAVAPELVTLAVQGAASPLWFLAAYTLCQALVPFMVGWHTRAPRATVVVLLAGAIVVDAVRYSTGIQQIGLLNLAFVWLLVQQIGFWYADGWFGRRPAWQLVTIAAIAYASLVPLTTWGPYSDNMLTNLNPPTLPLVALAIAQACVLRLLRPALAALMNTHAARAVVFLAGTRLMTIYLWHLPVILILTGVTLLIPGAAPEPGTAAWWWSRPLLYVLVLAGVFGLSLVVGRWEAPREVMPTPPTAVVVVAAVLSFIPSFLVMQFFMDFVIAVTGSVLLSVSVLMLGRWGQRASAAGQGAPL